MYSIKKSFEGIRKKISALVEENETLKSYISEIEQNIRIKDNEIENYLKENKKIKEENRLIKLSSVAGKDTLALKTELADILREIDESLELVRGK